MGGEHLSREVVRQRAPTPAVGKGDHIMSGVDQSVPVCRRVEVEEPHTLFGNSLVVGARVTVGEGKEVPRVGELVEDRLQFVVEPRGSREPFTFDQLWKYSDV